jgi:uncharacterized protein (TIGR03067 family)
MLNIRWYGVFLVVVAIPVLGLLSCNRPDDQQQSDPSRSGGTSNVATLNSKKNELRSGGRAGEKKSADKRTFPTTVVKAKYGEKVGDGVVKIQYLEAFEERLRSNVIVVRVWADSDKPVTLAVVGVAPWKNRDTMQVFDMDKLALPLGKDSIDKPKMGKPFVLNKDNPQTVPLLVLDNVSGRRLADRHFRAGELVKVELRLKGEPIPRTFQVTICSDKEFLQGEWKHNKRVIKGVATLGNETSDLVVKGNGIMPKGSKEVAATFELDPKTHPKQLDLTALRGDLKGVTRKGIYELEGDALRICIPINQEIDKRPSSFDSKTGDEYMTDYYEKKCISSRNPSEWK